MEDQPAATPEEQEQAPDLQEEHEAMGGHGRDEPEAPPAAPRDRQDE